MSKTIENLSPLAVQRLKKNGMYGDGGGLYLRVSSGKYWMFRYSQFGKRREMGIGIFPDMSLAEARVKAGECRRMVADGQDPLIAREKAQRQLAAEQGKAKTFQECAEAYIDTHKTGWRNPKHIQQWENTLKTYTYPTIGAVNVADVEVGMIMNILEQKKKEFGKGKTLWLARTETASRLRGRIEVILDWAKSRGLRNGENPARWRGHMENLLPTTSKTQRVQHQPALPYDQIGDFMALLKDQDVLAAKVLQFVILTASRTSEALGATWDEIDLKRKTWTIPADRIKAGREHRVPLSDASIALLGDAKESGLVFPGRKPKRPLSNMAMLVLLRRINRTDITVHGFRSSFRDWTAEQTAYPREAAEAALAHAVGDKVEAAYRRSDLFDKRRLMMDQWAQYCATPSSPSGGKIVPIRKANKH